MMEIISETELAPALPQNIFVPNVFVNISDFMEKKLTIMQQYTMEMGEHPFPRNAKNIEALATFRGATVSCRYAEAFMLLREIV